MVFNLSVGLQDVPLGVDERKGSGAANMETFSMIIAGTHYMLYVALWHLRSVCPLHFFIQPIRRSV